MCIRESAAKRNRFTYYVDGRMFMGRGRVIEQMEGKVEREKIKRRKEGEKRKGREFNFLFSQFQFLFFTMLHKQSPCQYQHILKASLCL